MELQNALRAESVLLLGWTTLNYRLLAYQLSFYNFRHINKAQATLREMSPLLFCIPLSRQLCLSFRLWHPLLAYRREHPSPAYILPTDSLLIIIIVPCRAAIRQSCQPNRCGSTFFN